VVATHRIRAAAPGDANGLPDDPILFFDATCGFCDRSVRFLLARDVGGRLRVAPLGGATYRALGVEAPGGTVVLHDSQGVHLRSAAILRALRIVGGGWGLLALGLGLIPAPLRDGLYRLVARWRGRLAPGLKGCPRPQPGDTARYLP
jgi:predicted DCC family thiol-disulfide oxidoreductase YuxK